MSLVFTLSLCTELNKYSPRLEAIATNPNPQLGESLHFFNITTTFQQEIYIVFVCVLGENDDKCVFEGLG